MFCFTNIPNISFSFVTCSMHKKPHQNAGNGIKETLFFKIFLGSMPPNPPRGSRVFGASRANSYPPPPPKFLSPAYAYECNCSVFIYLFSFATKAGSPQQREPITVGPYYLTHPVNFPCGRKPEYPEKTHDFRQSVDYTLFT